MITNTDLSSYGSIIEDIEKLIDSLPVDAALIRMGHDVAACNQLAMDKGVVPDIKCYKAWLNRDKPCEWCHAGEAMSFNRVVDYIVHAGVDESGRVVDLDRGGIVTDFHWIPVACELYVHFNGINLTDPESRKKAIADVSTFIEKLPPDIKTDIAATITTIESALKEQMENLNAM